MKPALAFAILLIGSSLPAQRRPPESPDTFVADMMAFDTNRDGRLARTEISDRRLLRLFDHADLDRDGFVTAEELRKLYLKESELFVAEQRGPGGRPDFGMPQRMGEIIPEPMQRDLHLTADQKQKLDALQGQVDTQLRTILTDQQRERLSAFGKRGGPPGMPGPRFPE